MSSHAWINLAYLIASMLSIVAFKLMTGPWTAVTWQLPRRGRHGDRAARRLLREPVVEAIAASGASGRSSSLGIAARVGRGVGPVMAGQDIR